jgi:hypothetical protein
MDRPQVGGKIDVLGVGKVLPAKHHDRVAVDRRLDGVAVGGLQRPREIDAGDLGDEAWCDRRNRDAQRSLLRL